MDNDYSFLKFFGVIRMPMLKVDGSSIYYSVKGQGIPIVFIHPPLLTSVNFEYQVENLAQHFQVITFDIRGHGKSESSSLPLTYPLIVDDIKQILNHLEIKKAFVCGYSTGGSIVLEFLLSAKDRSLGGIVVSGMSEVSSKLLHEKISIGVKLSNAEAISVLAWAIALRNSDSTKLFKKMVTDAKRGNATNIEQYYKYSLHYNCTKRLGDITHPTMLVYGKKDKQFHYYAQLLHKKVPNNDLVFIENESHRIPTKSSHELNEIIRQFIHKNRQGEIPF